MRRLLAICTLLLLIAGTAVAHGDMLHIKGKVVKVSEHSFTVETTDKETKEIEVSAHTKFVKGELPASMKDLKVGDRLVVLAKKSGEKLVAAEVMFAASKRGKNPK